MSNGKLLAPLFLTAFLGVQGAQADTKTETSVSKHDSFYNGIKTLCKENKYVLLGDTNHTSVEIMELLADPKFTAAAQKCGALILEKAIEENEGYPELKPLDSQIYVDAVVEVQSVTADHSATRRYMCRARIQANGRRWP